MFIDVCKTLHIIPPGKLAETGCIPDNTKIHWHFFQACVQIIEHEDGLAGVWQIFAEFLVAAGLRLVGREVSRVKIYGDDAGVILQNHAATCNGMAGDRQHQPYEQPASRTG